MKVLLVNFFTNGHHLIYFNNIKVINVEFHLLSPVFPGCEKYVKTFTPLNINRKFGIFSYLEILFKVREIKRKQKIDIVHFLYADLFYRFFGIGFNKKDTFLFTFHHMRFSFLRNLTYKLISKNILLGIVHTSEIYKNLINFNLHNFTLIKYPSFLFNVNNNHDPFFSKSTRLLFLGTIRYDKGVDLFLEIIDKLISKYNIEIHIVGEILDTGKFNYLYNFKKKMVYMNLNYVSDEMYFSYLNHCDILILPYRKIFNGASGPLTDAIKLNKIIVGPNHQSLGKQLSEYSYGFTFETENIESLESTIIQAITYLPKKEKKDLVINDCDIIEFRKNYEKAYKIAYNKDEKY